MAAVSLFWDTNMAAVTSCENTLYKVQEKVRKGCFPWILPGARATSRAIATKFEEEIIRLKNLCTHMDIRPLFL